MNEFPQLNKKSLKVDAIIHTNKGDIELALFPDLTPHTVKNFIELAKQGYYDEVIFHRIIKDFMIQGGDPTGTGMGGESIYGGKFADEFVPNLFNLNGALSMANAGPGTNGSQFFIVTADQVPEEMVGQLVQAGFPDEIIEVYRQEGGTPWLDQRHTVFGQVIGGQATVDTIENVPTGIQDRPEEDIKIESITINE